MSGCRRWQQTAGGRSAPGRLAGQLHRYLYQPGYADGGLVLTELAPKLREVGALATEAWDAATADELAPADAEMIVDKSCIAFFGTRLEHLLVRLRVRSLVLCRVTTDMYAETTACETSQRDRRAFAVSGVTGEVGPVRHQHALHTGFGFGWRTQEKSSRALSLARLPKWDAVRLKPSLDTNLSYGIRQILLAPQRCADKVML
jgi:nicotinamidase-related amidase